MPVEDHEVHPLTRQGADAKYGCWGESKRKPFYWARNVNRRLIPPLDTWIMVSDYSSKGCRYDLSLTDPKCNECPRQGDGVAYNQKVRKETQ